jgi:hypothetical protein
VQFNLMVTLKLLSIPLPWSQALLLVVPSPQ